MIATEKRFMKMKMISKMNYKNKSRIRPKTKVKIKRKWLSKLTIIIL